MHPDVVQVGWGTDLRRRARATRPGIPIRPITGARSRRVARRQMMMSGLLCSPTAMSDDRGRVQRPRPRCRRARPDHQPGPQPVRASQVHDHRRRPVRSRPVAQAGQLEPGLLELRPLIVADPLATRRVRRRRCRRVRTASTGSGAGRRAATGRDGARGRVRSRVAGSIPGPGRGSDRATGSSGSPGDGLDGPAGEADRSRVELPSGRGHPDGAHLAVGHLEVAPVPADGARRRSAAGSGARGA